MSNEIPREQTPEEIAEKQHTISEGDLAKETFRKKKLTNVWINGVPQPKTPEEITNLKQSRLISDAELLKAGAYYEIVDGEKRLIPTQDNLKTIEFEMKDTVLLKPIRDRIGRGGVYLLPDMLNRIVKTSTENKWLDKEMIEKVAETSDVVRNLISTMKEVNKLIMLINNTLKNRDREIGVDDSALASPSRIEDDIRRYMDGMYFDVEQWKEAHKDASDEENLNILMTSAWGDAEQLKDMKSVGVKALDPEIISRIENITNIEGLQESLSDGLFTAMQKELNSNERGIGWYQATNIEYQRKALPLLETLSKELPKSIKNVTEDTIVMIASKF